MVFDYETAWAELLTLLETDSRPNWGARQLRDEMGRILSRHRVVEGSLPQALRLYGVEVEARLQHLVHQEDADPTPPEIDDPGVKVSSGPPHRVTEEVIDEHRSTAAALG